VDTAETGCGRTGGQARVFLWTGRGQPRRSCGPSCGPRIWPKLGPETPCAACLSATRHLLTSPERGPPRGRPRDVGSSGRPRLRAGSRPGGRVRGADDRAIGRPCPKGPCHATTGREIAGHRARQSGSRRTDRVTGREADETQRHEAHRPGNRTGSGRVAAARGAPTGQPGGERTGRSGSGSDRPGDRTRSPEAQRRWQRTGRAIGREADTDARRDEAHRPGDRTGSGRSVVPHRRWLSDQHPATQDRRGPSISCMEGPSSCLGRTGPHRVLTGDVQRPASDRCEDRDHERAAACRRPGRA
jgi:hypothetical protein